MAGPEVLKEGDWEGGGWFRCGWGEWGCEEESIDWKEEEVVPGRW